MYNIFQYISSEIPKQTADNSAIIAVLGMIAIAGIIIGAVVCLTTYIYFSLALRAIAKKSGYNNLWLAWIPFANLFLFPILTGKNWMWGFLFFIPVVNAVFLTICLWNLLEKNDYDGKWSLIMMGSMVSKPMFPITSIALLVIIGILAWRKK